VQSASARELITDLFRRQRADPALTRAEVLRQAMMALLDGPGAVDGSERTVYSYAHPLFWAPYSVIGGRRRDLRWPFPLPPRFARGEQQQ
jgi:CHAT domain-containing protein